MMDLLEFLNYHTPKEDYSDALFKNIPLHILKEFVPYINLRHIDTPDRLIEIFDFISHIRKDYALTWFCHLIIASRVHQEAFRGVLEDVLIPYSKDSRVLISPDPREDDYIIKFPDSKSLLVLSEVDSSSRNQVRDFIIEISWGVSPEESVNTLAFECLKYFLEHYEEKNYRSIWADSAESDIIYRLLHSPSYPLFN